MTLSFSWEWQSAPDVRTPELAATWSRLMIEVGDIITTLVEERDRSHGVRKSLDVPTYPLAEWLTLNWWILSTPAHRPGEGQVNLVGAGSGFPWPDISFRSDRDFIRAEIRRRDRDSDFVRFLTQGRAILEADQFVGEIASFIDSTVRRLEDSGISGTLLQGEWSAIQMADAEERDFCTVAAAWGFDPYNMSTSESERILWAATEIDDPALLTELATAVDFDSVGEAAEWLKAAATHVSVGTSRIPPIEPFTPSRSNEPRPWRIGYQRAQMLRELLNLAPTVRAPIEALVGVSDADTDPPSNVVGLVKVTEASAGIVLGRHTDEAARRFAGARALARKASALQLGYSLLTRGARYSDQVERAFAAEFLAPADGLKQLLNGNYSEDSQRDAARTLGVSISVVEHQIENQLAA